VLWGSIAGDEAYITRSNEPRLRGSPPDHEPESSTLDGWFWILSSTPTFLNCSMRICSTRSRVWSPVVVVIVSDARALPLLRIPSLPRTQPAWSRSCLALFGSYDSCVRLFGEAQPWETGDVPGLAF